MAKPKKLSASEAVFGFAGWLTTRDEQVVMSAHDEAGRVAELCAIFCKVNGLAEPRRNWANALTHPTENTEGDK